MVKVPTIVQRRTAADNHLVQLGNRCYLLRVFSTKSPMTADLRFPIGEFVPPQSLTPALRARSVETIAATPAALRAALQGLNESQLDTPYRPGGWTVRQLAHHVPDSHINAYVRFKLALTEDAPLVKPYDEAAWARLEDSISTPIETSLTLLDAVHDRWVRILKAMSASDFSRPYATGE